MVRQLARRTTAAAAVVLTKFDSNLEDPEAEVIEKRLHSLLVVAALLLSASIGLLNLPSEAEISLQGLDLVRSHEALAVITSGADFWMSCTLISWACQLERESRAFLDAVGTPGIVSPLERLRDGFLEWASLAVQLSMLGIVLTMLTYLSLNHVKASSESLRVWYKLNALVVFVSYGITGASAVCMCFAFTSLSLLKGGIPLYTRTLQRTYLLGYTSMALAVYILGGLLLCNSIKGEIVGRYQRRVTLPPVRSGADYVAAPAALRDAAPWKVAPAQTGGLAYRPLGNKNKRDDAAAPSVLRDDVEVLRDPNRAPGAAALGKTVVLADEGHASSARPPRTIPKAGGSPDSFARLNLDLEDLIN